MKRQLLNTALAIGCSAAVTLCSGCLSIFFIDQKTEPKAAEKPTEKSEVKVSVQSVVQNTAKSAAKPAPQPELEKSEIILLDTRPEQLRLTVKPEGGDAEAAALSAKLDAAISQKLGGSDAIVGQQGRQELILTVSSKVTTVDQAGEYYRLNCEITLTLKSAATGRIFGGKTIRLVGKRVLGREAAVAQFEAAAADAAEWCRTALKGVTAQEIGVATLKIRLKAAPEKYAAAISTITSRLTEEKSILSCEYAGKEESGIALFRIAYVKSAFPEGIANRIALLIGSEVNHK